MCGNVTCMLEQPICTHAAMRTCPVITCSLELYYN